MDGSANLVNPNEIALREDGVSTLDQDWAAFRMSRMIDGSATVVSPNAFALHLTGNKPRNQSTGMVDSSAKVDGPSALRLQTVLRTGIPRTVQGQPQGERKTVVSNRHPTAQTDADDAARCTADIEVRASQVRRP